MSENVPLWSCGESSQSAPSSFSNIIKVSNSNLSDHIGATTTIESNRSDNNSNVSFTSDYMGATFSSEGSLYDIFRVLSEVPLHATEDLHEYNQHLEASTSKNEECFMQDKRGIELQDYTNIVAQRSQIYEGVEAKEDTLVSEPEPTHTLPSDQNLDHLPIKSREQRRRELINEKLKTLKALIPACDKRDHASILDDGIKYIKFLKFQIEMLSTRSIGQRELYAKYNLRMMMMMGGTGFPHWPLHFPMVGPYNYPLMVRPNSYYPVTPHFATQPISPLVLPPQPSAPIRLQPPIPYIGFSNTSAAGLATTSPSTTEQLNNLFSETNRQ